MEFINSNAGLIVLIGIILNAFFFFFSGKRNHKQFEALRQQRDEHFEASQRLTAHIAKKTIVEEPPPEYEDAHYPKPKKRTWKTPEEAEIDYLAKGKRLLNLKG